MQLGTINSAFQIRQSKANFQIYLYGQPKVSVFGYDASLQGGVINTKSVYTISSRHIERFTANYNYGLVLKTKTLYYDYTRSEITREFKTGSSAKWGGIKIGFTF